MSSKAEQSTLFDNPPMSEDNWGGMPEFTQEDQKPWQSIKVHFASRDDRAAFSRLVEQKITDKTQSLWYPEAEIGRYGNKRWVAKQPRRHRYPVFVPTYGRADSRLTIKCFESIGVEFFAVVQPQEYDQYAAVLKDPRRLITLPESVKGLVPTRNWIWDYASELGVKRFWTFDDNIKWLYRFHNNLKVPVADCSILAAIEDFTDRYENLPVTGMQYFMFASRKTKLPVYVPNTRVYSNMLIDTFAKNPAGIPYRNEGVYNDDTDLCLRMLKDGFCTILFNAFLIEKSVTMTVQGGNTDIYQGSGRWDMAEELRAKHPDVTVITEKWGRWQHHVDYSPFRKNKLQLRDGFEIPTEPDDYGMELRRCCEDCKTILPYEFDGERCTPCETKQTK